MQNQQMRQLFQIRYTAYSGLFLYGANFRIFRTKNWKLHYVLCAHAWTYKNKTYKFIQKLVCTKICPYKNILLYGNSFQELKESLFSDLNTIKSFHSFPHSRHFQFNLLFATLSRRISLTVLCSCFTSKQHT